MKRNKVGIIIYDNLHTINTDAIIWSVNYIKKEDSNYPRLNKYYTRRIDYKLFGIRIIVKKNTDNGKK